MKSKTEPLLELAKMGIIDSYSLINVDKNGVVGETSKNRNTERLIITFKNGTNLIIDSLCSDSGKNTTLHFKLR